MKLLKITADIDQWVEEKEIVAGTYAGPAPDRH